MIETTMLVAVLIALSIGIILTFTRLLRGPFIATRVIAIDVMITLGIGISAVYAILTGQSLFLDVATILALVSFLGTVAFAFYLERSADRDAQS
jgi:multicomponent Na+:H+ antiporter subunit F